MMQNVYEKICPGLVSGITQSKKACGAAALHVSNCSMFNCLCLLQWRSPGLPVKAAVCLIQFGLSLAFPLQFISLMSSFGKAGSWSDQGVFGWELLQQIKLKPRWRQQSSSGQWCQTGSKWPTSSIWHWSLDLIFQYFSILSWAIV